MTIADLSVSTEIPLLQVTDFRFMWCLGDHAVFELEGILNSEAQQQDILKKSQGFRV